MIRFNCQFQLRCPKPYLRIWHKADGTFIVQDNSFWPEPIIQRHAQYLEAAWDTLGVTEDAVLVLHDWGSGLGFDWAARYPERVRGIAYMEAIVAPVPDWEAFPEAARSIFQALRSPAGEEMVIEKNLFIMKTHNDALHSNMIRAAQVHKSVENTEVLFDAVVRSNQRLHFQ